ncbi:MAG: HIRAN domain-containing protein [Tepidanaerobacteraceae bacterium]|nr:HIRAN domain-containing protein [Tepidanaerobacteraceae bacterium]
MENGTFTFNIWLGVSDIAEKKGELFRIKMGLSAKDSFSVKDLSMDVFNEIFTFKHFNDVLKMNIESPVKYAYFADISGFAVVDAPAHLHNELKNEEVLIKLAESVCFFKNGALGPGLAMLRLIDANLSESMFLEKMLPSILRTNIAAEYFYGNSIKVTDDGFNFGFFKIPEIDPKLIYTEPGISFYIHPTGLCHERRYNSIDFLKHGEKVVFEREQNNIHDPNAVHIYTEKGIDLGYIPRCIASIMNFNMRRGARYETLISLVLPETFHPDQRIVIKAKMLHDEAA